MDDILDYVSLEETLGKAIGKDLSEGKITLPLIRALQACSPGEKDLISRIVQNPNRSIDDIGLIMQAVKSYGGIDYTVKKAEEFVLKAKSFLTPFSPSKEKDALLALSDYTIGRKW